VVRQMCDRGCDVIAYAVDWGRAPLALQCQALRAGVNDVLDSGRPDFQSELARRLLAAIQKSEQRRKEKQRLGEAMVRFGIVGESGAMLSLGRRILKVSPLSDLPVLISGEMRRQSKARRTAGK
jgi:DNA-binding NtrC family response regulator